MRALVYSTITGDPVLAGLGVVPAGVFSGDGDTPQERPFLQLRWGRNDVALKKTQIGRRTLVIWIHDQPGDYAARIDPILVRLRALIPTLEGKSNGAGYVVGVEWLGDSEDLSDDGHGTITRTVSFALVGSGQ